MESQCHQRVGSSSWKDGEAVARHRRTPERQVTSTLQPDCAIKPPATEADDQQFVAVSPMAAPLRNVSSRSNSGALDECKQGYRRAVSAAGAFAAFAIGIDGVASARVTSTVTNRASSQSAHFAAFFIRSVRYTALNRGVREW